MSDVPPPSLRLKPRTRVDGEGPAVTDVEAPASSVAETASDSAESPKLRLRPKLDLSSVTPVSESPDALQPQIDTPPVKATFALKPRINPEQIKTLPDTIPAVFPSPPSAAAVEPPKFKLKEKALADTTQPTPSPSARANPATSFPPPSPSPSSGGSGTIPPILVAEPPAPKTPVSFPPPVPKLNSKKIVDDTEDDAAPGKSSAKVAVYVLVLLLIGGGGFAYLKLKPKAASATPVASETPKRPSTPSATLNELSTVPARAINKAKETIATVEATEHGNVDAVVGEAVFQRHPKPAPTPVAKPVVTSTTELAPGIKATTTAMDNVGGDASPEFRTWVAQARISGVFQGTPPRVLINGRTVSATQLVDETLKITFDGIDSATKSLVFRDHTGATVSRKF
ncbi:MAG: hypothetical protein ABIV50_10745 [Opitutus sp.]